MKSKVYTITIEQILESKVCVITDYLRDSVYSLGVCYSDELNCGCVRMFNSDGDSVISARVERVNGRRVLSEIDLLCDITDNDVYAWKCLVRLYRMGVNDLGLMPSKAIERGIVTIRELEMCRKETVPTWYRDTYVAWAIALLYAIQFCDFYKKKGGE